MRLLTIGAVVGCVLLYPTLAPAQTVKSADVVGTWQGLEGRALLLSDRSERGKSWLTLWPDSLWWSYRAGTDWGMYGGGRWRLVGDTIYLLNDIRYRTGIGMRVQATCKGKPPTSDSLPRIDPSSWPDSVKQGSFSFPFAGEKISAAVEAYRVAYIDHQLSLTPVDSLALNPQAAPTRTYNPVKSQRCE